MAYSNARFQDELRSSDSKHSGGADHGCDTTAAASFSDSESIFCSECETHVTKCQFLDHLRSRRHIGNVKHRDYMKNPMRWIPLPHRLATDIDSDGWPVCTVCSTPTHCKFMVQAHWNSDPHRLRLDYYLSPELAKAQRIPEAWLVLPPVSWDPPDRQPDVVPPPPPEGYEMLYFEQLTKLQRRACFYS